MTGEMNLAYDYPLLGAFWTLLWIFLWVMWIFLLFRIFSDIFRDDSLNGWAKAGWSIFAVVLPFLGVFVYLIARGKGMGEREAHQARARQHAFDSYVREAAGDRQAECGRGTCEALGNQGQRRPHGRGVPARQGEDPALKHRSRANRPVVEAWRGPCRPLAVAHVRGK